MVYACKIGIVDLFHFRAIIHVTVFVFENKIETFAADNAPNLIAGAVSKNIPAVFHLVRMEFAEFRIPISTHIYESPAVLGINPRYSGILMILSRFLCPAMKNFLPPNHIP